MRNVNIEYRPGQMIAGKVKKVARETAQRPLGRLVVLNARLIKAAYDSNREARLGTWNGDKASYQSRRNELYCQKRNVLVDESLDRGSVLFRVPDVPDFSEPPGAPDNDY